MRETAAHRTTRRIAILAAPMPTVAVICGSRSDLPTLKGCFDVLDSYGISVGGIGHQRPPPGRCAPCLRPEAEAAGVQLFIGAAGLAAHLPGVLASLTAKPVIGIPLDGGSLGGADALYSVVQMPPGVPVATRRHRQRRAPRTPRTSPRASWRSPDPAVARARGRVP